MKQIHITLSIFSILVLLAPPSSQAQLGTPSEPFFEHEILDPVGDATMRILGGPEADRLNIWPPQLFVVPADLNQDGSTDYLISANFFTTGKAGQIWYVYLDKGDAYSRLSGSIVFDMENAVISPDPAGGATVITDMYTGGGGTAALEEIRISDSGVQSEVVKKYDWSVDEPSTVHDAALKRGPQIRPLLIRLNFGMLQEKYENQIPRKIREGAAVYYDNPRKDLPMDHRDPAYASEYLDSVEELYALGSSAVIGASEVAQGGPIGDVAGSGVADGAPTPSEAIAGESKDDTSGAKDSEAGIGPRGDPTAAPPEEQALMLRGESAAEAESGIVAPPTSDEFSGDSVHGVGSARVMALIVGGVVVLGLIVVGLVRKQRAG